MVSSRAPGWNSGPTFPWCSLRRRATGVKPAKTRRNAKPDDCATPIEVHNHLSSTPTRQLVGWADTACCQISLAQQCMPSPTVGQIRRANAWVRQTHQVADLKLTFLSIPPEQLRFVIHTDHSSKDQDGTGRTQGGYIFGATDPSMGAGHRGMEIAQAETRMHVDTVRERPKALSSGLGHLEWIMCVFATVLFSAFSLVNRDAYIQRFSAISVIDCKNVFGFVTKPGAPTGIDDKRCAIDMAIIRGCLRRMGVLFAGPATQQNNRHEREVELDTVQVWDEEWQCHISVLAPRRRERNRSRSRGNEEERQPKELKPAECSQRGKGRVIRSRVAGDCRRPLSPRITSGETDERGTAETPHTGTE